MSTDKYAALDAAILHRVTTAALPPTFAQILHDSKVSALVSALAQQHNASKPPYSHKSTDRFVDARLQALRKAGKLRFAHKGWAIPQTAPAREPSHG